MVECRLEHKKFCGKPCRHPPPACTGGGCCVQGFACSQKSSGARSFFSASLSWKQWKKTKTPIALFPNKGVSLSLTKEGAGGWGWFFFQLAATQNVEKKKKPTPCVFLRKAPRTDKILFLLPQISRKLLANLAIYTFWFPVPFEGFFYVCVKKICEKYI